MNIKEFIQKAERHLRYRVERRGLYDRMDDEAYLKMLYKRAFKKELDLENPVTFSEKLQWLKLHDRKPEYTTMVDKYGVREYIANKIGEEYLIPCLGVWDRFEDIDFDKLPDQFVLKCTHNSGGVVVCTDKKKLNRKKVARHFNSMLGRDYYKSGREWPYKNVPRKIICEQYMADSANQSSLTDYKFYCFNGVVDCVMVCLDRFSGDIKLYFFDKNWELKRLNPRGKNAPEGFTVPKPICIDEMVALAEKLSAGMPFSRIDLYECNGKIYFGEITLFPKSGFNTNILPEANQYFGDLIDLSMVKNNLPDAKAN